MFMEHLPGGGGYIYPANTPIVQSNGLFTLNDQRTREVPQLSRRQFALAWLQKKEG